MTRLLCLLTLVLSVSAFATLYVADERAGREVDLVGLAPYVQFEALYQRRRPRDLGRPPQYRHIRFIESWEPLAVTHHFRPIDRLRIEIEVERRGYVPAQGTTPATWHRTFHTVLNFEPSEMEQFVRLTREAIGSPWAFLSMNFATQVHAPAFSLYSRYLDRESHYRVRYEARVIDLSGPEPRQVFRFRTRTEPKRPNGQASPCPTAIEEA